MNRQPVSSSVPLAFVAWALLWGSPAIAQNGTSQSFNQGLSLAIAGKNREAIAFFDKAIAADGRNANAFRERGTAWRDLGDYQKAVADYRQALVLKPNDPPTLNLMAWLQATCPDEQVRDAKLAFANAAQAYQADSRNASYLDTLAAAYAANGDFPKALEWQAKSIAAAKVDRGLSDVQRAELESRLNLYRQGEAFRMPVQAQP